MFHLIDHPRRKLQNQSALEIDVLLVNRLSPRLLSLYRALLFAVLLSLVLSAIGCGRKKQTARNVPRAPSLPAYTSASKSKPATSKASTSTPSKANSKAAGRDLGPLASVPGIHVDPNAKVVWSQVGYASWYGPNYNSKKAANGETYDQNEMTAANNTLPLNSIVRVINLKSNQTTVVRITDRGPFIGDRIIDLSYAAAKAIDVYLPGTAQVRLEVLEAPHPIETGGRWCVQIGAFQAQSGALHLKEQLLDRYSGAQVLQFKGPTGYWVRIRVAQDDKDKAREVFEHTRVDEGGVFMVRLD